MRPRAFIVLAILSSSLHSASAQSVPNSGSPSKTPAASKFHIDSQRLQSRLEKLSEFGRNPEGGVTRLAYSETELPAREYVIGLMKQAGLEVRTDAAANIFGRGAGSGRRPGPLLCSAPD